MSTYEDLPFTQESFLRTIQTVVSSRENFCQGQSIYAISNIKVIVTFIMYTTPFSFLST
jgi:hypothetical protein